jgi:predicted  nucleic acid-binding Zn-ribbon protein
MLPSQSQTPRSTTPPQEDCLPPLQSQLSSLQAQIANLAATLKSTRRDSQKADAALKSEIEVLNRASEKASAAEAKARQRIRALEDAARRANEGKEEVDHVRSELESEVPGLRKQVREREEECEALRKEAGKVHREREAKEEVRRRRIEGVKADIGSTEHRLERLSGRQEKLEGTVLPDLEKTLREIEKEIEEVESSLSVDGLGGQYPAPISRPTQIPPISPPQYRRHQPHTPMTYRIGQDGMPPGLGLSNPYAGSTLSHATSSAFTHSTSSSLSHSKISTLSHPTSPVPPHAGVGSSTASTLGMSTLSSKAAPFEPTRSFRSSFPPLSPPPSIAPIQRPIGTGAFQRVGRSLPNGALDESTRAI